MRYCRDYSIDPCAYCKYGGACVNGEARVKRYGCWINEIDSTMPCLPLIENEAPSSEQFEMAEQISNRKQWFRAWINCQGNKYSNPYLFLAAAKYEELIGLLLLI